MENKVTLIGRIVSDIEASATRNTGMACVKFRVADDYYDYSTKTRKTQFFRCQAFGKVAENIAAHFFKGKRIAMYGHLLLENYEKDGVKKTAVTVTVAEWDFADSKTEKPAVNTEAGEEV